MELTIKYQKRKITILAIVAVVMLCAAIPIIIMSFRNIGYLYVGLVCLALAGMPALTGRATASTSRWLTELLVCS